MFPCKCFNTFFSYHTGVELVKKENPILVGETIRINASSYAATRIDWNTFSFSSNERGVPLSNRQFLLREYDKPGQ